MRHSFALLSYQRNFGYTIPGLKIKMFNVRNIIVEDSIPRVKFACDLSLCKGGCCTLAGGTGAPLLDEEIEELKKAVGVVKSTLPLEHFAAIEEKGCYEGKPGAYTTMCYNNRACVFVLYEDGIAKCSIEKAYLDGKLNWKKPVSCHLFPIRVDHGNTERLRYEHINECNPAIEQGTKDEILLTDFLEEPLTRAFGSSWYKEFQVISEWERNNPHSA
jgi:hypothetical protein